MNEHETIYEGNPDSFEYKGVEIPIQLKESFELCLEYFDALELEDDIIVGFAEEARDCVGNDDLVGCFVSYANQIAVEQDIEWEEDVVDFLIRVGLVEHPVKE
jgi:hypothetical protein